MEASSGESWIRSLLDAGRALTSELDLGVVLDRILQTAREMTGARYAAFGVLGAGGEFEQLLTSGIDEETRRAIGELPHGLGVVGLLIADARPLRLADLTKHPASYRFPAGHPQMRTFLGVPILIRGRAWGNLYLTEKASGEFTEADEEAVVILAGWAAVAIDNARLYEASERRRLEAEKAIRGLEATRDVTVAIGREIELDHVLEMIVTRGRALVDARSLVILLREDDELVLQASAGHAQEMRGTRLSITDSTSGQVLRRGRPERITDVAGRLRIAPRELGVADPHTALLVPMIHQGEGVGVLVAFDRGAEGSEFSEDDEQLLRTFAASAATAVALAQSVQTERLRSSLAAADAERKRWARELHDETLQGLAGLRLLLAAARKGNDIEQARAAMGQAIEHIEQDVENLRSIITELRPAALDELGLRVAIEALTERQCAQNGLKIESELDLPGWERALGGELQTAIYRLVQEALTNVVKHARASLVRLAVRESSGEIAIEVQDDGEGFDPEAASGGFGLTGMRERVRLVNGSLAIRSGPQGTLVRICLPLHGDVGAGVASARSRPEQVASKRVADELGAGG